MLFVGEFICRFCAGLDAVRVRPKNFTHLENWTSADFVRLRPCLINDVC